MSTAALIYCNSVGVQLPSVMEWEDHSQDIRRESIRPVMVTSHPPNSVFCAQIEPSTSRPGVIQIFLKLSIEIYQTFDYENR